MNSAARIPLALALFVVVSAAPARAHAPYERNVGTIVDSTGRPLTVVLRFTDGIIGPDPATVIVRDSSRVVVAETAPATHWIVRCGSYAACRAFAYEVLNPAPVHVVRLEAGGFVPEQSRVHWTFGIILPLWEHAVWYLVVLASFSAIPVIAWRVAQRRRTLAMSVVWALCALIASGWLLLLALGLLFGAPFSVLWVLAGLAAIAVTTAGVRAWARRDLTRA